jgi:hypothetical protein
MLGLNGLNAEPNQSLPETFLAPCIGSFKTRGTAKYFVINGRMHNGTSKNMKFYTIVVHGSNDAVVATDHSDRPLEKGMYRSFEIVTSEILSSQNSGTKCTVIPEYE